MKIHITLKETKMWPFNHIFGLNCDYLIVGIQKKSQRIGIAIIVFTFMADAFNQSDLHYIIL